MECESDFTLHALQHVQLENRLSSPPHRLTTSSSPSIKSTAHPGRRAVKSRTFERQEWQDRFLNRCVERIRTERAAAVAKQRGHGLAAYEERAEAWSAEEEAVLRRMVSTETRKLMHDLQRQGEDEGFDSLEDALSSYESMQQQPQTAATMDEESGASPVPRMSAASHLKRQGRPGPSRACEHDSRDLWVINIVADDDWSVSSLSKLKLGGCTSRRGVVADCALLLSLALPFKRAITGRELTRRPCISLCAHAYQCRHYGFQVVTTRLYRSDSTGSGVNAAGSGRIILSRSLCKST